MEVLITKILTFMANYIAPVIGFVYCAYMMCVCIFLFFRGCDYSERVLPLLGTLICGIVGFFVAKDFIIHFHNPRVISIASILDVFIKLAMPISFILQALIYLWLVFVHLTFYKKEETKYPWLKTTRKKNLLLYLAK